MSWFDGHHEEEADGDDIVGGVRECARADQQRWRHFIKISLRNRLFLNANDIQTENHRSNPMLKGTIEGGRQLFHSFITATVWWQFRSRLTSTTLLYLLAAHDNSYSPISFDGRIITLFRA